VTTLHGPCDARSAGGYQPDEDVIPVAGMAVGAAPRLGNRLLGRFHSRQELIDALLSSKRLFTTIMSHRGRTSVYVIWYMCYSDDLVVKVLQELIDATGTWGGRMVLAGEGGTSTRLTRMLMPMPETTSQPHFASKRSNACSSIIRRVLRLAPPPLPPCTTMSQPLWQAS
jgi:hypothetical protein